jgi:uncharacterized membrane protein
MTKGQISAIAAGLAAVFTSLAEADGDFANPTFVSTTVLTAFAVIAALRSPQMGQPKDQ